MGPSAADGQGQFWGMRGRAITPPKRRGRPRLAIYRAAPRIPQGRLFDDPEYLEYKRRRKELGL